MIQSNSTGTMLSFFKNRPVSDYVRIRSAKPSDLDALGTLILNGVAIHDGKIWTCEKSRAEWLGHLYGDNQKLICEETRIATIGQRCVGAFTLEGVTSSVSETWVDAPAILRLFTLGADSYSEELVHKLLDDAVKIARYWSLDHLSVDVGAAKAPLLAAFTSFGFHKVVAEIRIGRPSLLGSQRLLYDMNRCAEPITSAKNH